MGVGVGDGVGVVTAPVFAFTVEVTCPLTGGVAAFGVRIAEEPILELNGIILVLSEGLLTEAPRTACPAPLGAGV